MTPTTRREPSTYTPESDRPSTVFGMPRRVWTHHILPTLLVAFVVWAVTIGKTTYRQSVADPPLAQSRFVSESLKRQQQRAEYFADKKLDSVIAAERFQRINDQFTQVLGQLAQVNRRLDCLANHQPRC